MSAHPNVLDEITAERARQDEQWGGPEHDDGHDCIDWCNWIDYQRQRAVGSALAGDRADWRERMVKIAALAVAAIESQDRVMARGAEAPEEDLGGMVGAELIGGDS